MIYFWKVYLNIRIFRKFWKINLKENNRIKMIASTFDTPITELGYRRTLTTIEGVVAPSHMMTSLREGYGDKLQIQILLSEHFHDSFYDDHVILIGGRVRNKITKKILNETDLDLSFEIHDEKHDIPRYIYDRSSKSTYTADITSPLMKTDYGVITKIPDPFNKDGTVFIFYGLHTFGTIGAAKMVSKKCIAHLMKCRRKLRGSWFQILLKVKVEGEEVYPEVVKGYKVSCKRDT